MPRPDVVDTELMLGVRNRDSIEEMAETTGKSVGYVHRVLNELQDLNYITPPRKRGAARDRTLTEQGEEYLLRSGHVPPKVFG
jgi:predicted transcriptional regulator